MTFVHGAKVFAEAARLGFKHTLSERLLLLGSFLVYSSIMFAYAAVFRGASASSLAPYNLTQADLIWYMGLAEFVLFCTYSFQYREFQQEIRSGEIALLLIRPCPLWVVKLGDAAGRYVAKLLLLAAPCLTLIAFIAGGSGPSAGHVLGLLLSACLSSILFGASFFMLGASCLWVRQAEPVFWIWQKCMFLLGALLWPLALYPAAVRYLAWATPFPAIIAAPAQWGLPGQGWGLAAAAVHQVFWCVAIVFLTARVSAAVLRAIQEGETA